MMYFERIIAGFPKLFSIKKWFKLGVLMVEFFFKHTPNSDFQSMCDHLFDHQQFISFCTVLPNNRIQMSPSDWPEVL